MRYIQRIKRLKASQPLTPYQQATLNKLVKRFNDVTQDVFVKPQYNSIING
jgi:hypothetical protein